MRDSFKPLGTPVYQVVLTEGEHSSVYGPYFNKGPAKQVRNKLRRQWPEATAELQVIENPQWKTIEE